VHTGRVDTSGSDATVRFGMLPTDAERPIAGQLALIQWADLAPGRWSFKRLPGAPPMAGGWCSSSR
jgi:hypothetical protein